jgi:hypothetical protein
VRVIPEAGSPILEVHRGFKQTGYYSQANVVVDEDAVTVYNAYCNQVLHANGTNRCVLSFFWRA